MSSLLRRGLRAALSVLLLIACTEIAQASQYKSFRVAVYIPAGVVECSGMRGGAHHDHQRHVFAQHRGRAHAQHGAHAGGHQDVS